MSAKVLMRETAARPELAREEYLRLLSAAKLLGKERIYLIMKLFACTGIRLSQLQSLTIEEVRAGRTGWSAAAAEIPAVLQAELLDYAERKEIGSGMLFRTRSGAELDRSNLSHEIQELSGPAKVESEKCNPHCLIYLYRNTQKKIQDSMSDLVRQASNRILEQEQNVIGWNR